VPQAIHIRTYTHTCYVLTKFHISNYVRPAELSHQTSHIYRRFFTTQFKPQHYATLVLSPGSSHERSVLHVKGGVRRCRHGLLITHCSNFHWNMPDCPEIIRKGKTRTDTCHFSHLPFISEKPSKTG
jgi:hypothetical protein